MTFRREPPSSLAQSPTVQLLTYRTDGNSLFVQQGEEVMKLASIQVKARIFAALFALLAAHAVHAQAYSGSITGLVTVTSQAL